MVVLELKTPNLSAWQRVLRHRFECDRVDTHDFNGYVTRFYIDKVKEPRIKHQGKRTWCIADNGFLWVQYFPDQCNYTIRTILNAPKNVEQWYIDICRPFMLDDQGIPRYEDWDLDVVVWPDREVELWDVDELEHSLQDGAISRDDYDLAWTTANKLVTDLRANKLILPRTESELPRWVKIDSSLRSE